MQNYKINLYDEFFKEWSEMLFQYILEHPDKRWNYGLLSENPNITWDIVQAHPEIPWDYDRLSGNPNITLNIVQAYPDKPWNYYWLSENKMEKSKEFFIRQKHQEWFRKSELYEELIAKVWHPSNIERWKYYDMDLFDDMILFD